MKLIPSVTLAEAWLRAAEHLLEQRNWLDTTLLLHIEEPKRIRPTDRVVADALNDFLSSHNKHSHHTIAETIFPGYEYMKRGVNGVYNYPDAIFQHIQAHQDARWWGTYAHRILRRTDANGHIYNPLAAMISKMRQKRPVKAAYEIGLTFDIAIYGDDEHREARLGGPCLSHLSFKLLDNRIHLTAVYRSHYYIHRAYGNLLGLARLQSFVADQAGAGIGPLVCHSTMARLESGRSYGWSKGDVTKLIRACGKSSCTRAELAATV